MLFPIFMHNILLHLICVSLTKMFDVYTRILRKINFNEVIAENSIFTQLLKEFGFISFYIIELYYTIAVTSFVRNEVCK